MRRLFAEPWINDGWRLVLVLFFGFDSLNIVLVDRFDILELEGPAECLHVFSYLSVSAGVVSNVYGKISVDSGDIICVIGRRILGMGFDCVHGLAILTFRFSFVGFLVRFTLLSCDKRGFPEVV